MDGLTHIDVVCLHDPGNLGGHKGLSVRNQPAHGAHNGG